MPHDSIITSQEMNRWREQSVWRTSFLQAVRLAEMKSVLDTGCLNEQLEHALAETWDGEEAFCAHARRLIEALQDPHAKVYDTARLRTMLSLMDGAHASSPDNGVLETTIIDGALYCRIGPLYDGCLDVLRRSYGTSWDGDVVLDLRRSIGGPLEESRHLAGLVSGEGHLISSLRMEDGEHPLSSLGPRLFRRRIDLVIGSATASCAEIFIQYCRDHGIGTIYGQPTVGKLYSQEIFLLVCGFGISFSTRRILSLRGAIQPDHCIDLPEDPALLVPAILQMRRPGRHGEERRAGAGA